jgi:hypothetical protein
MNGKAFLFDSVCIEAGSSGLCASLTDWFRPVTLVGESAIGLSKDGLRTRLDSSNLACLACSARKRHGPSPQGGFYSTSLFEV